MDRLERREGSKRRTLRPVHGGEWRSLREESRDRGQGVGGRGGSGVRGVEEEGERESTHPHPSVSPPARAMAGASFEPGSSRSRQGCVPWVPPPARMLLAPTPAPPRRTRPSLSGGVGDGLRRSSVRDPHALGRRVERALQPHEPAKAVPWVPPQAKDAAGSDAARVGRGLPRRPGVWNGLRRRPVHHTHALGRRVVRAQQPHEPAKAVCPGSRRQPGCCRLRRPLPRVERGLPSPGVGTGSDGCRAPPARARPTRRFEPSSSSSQSCALGADASQCAVASWAGSVVRADPAVARRREPLVVDRGHRAARGHGARQARRGEDGAGSAAGQRRHRDGGGAKPAHDHRRPRTRTTRWTRPGF